MYLDFCILTMTDRRTTLYHNTSRQRRAIKSIWRFQCRVPITEKIKSPKELIFPWQHSIATPVHSFLKMYLGVETRINVKRYEIFLERILQFNWQYDVFDSLLKFIWHIFNLRILTQRTLFFDPQPDVTVTKLFSKLFH